MSNDLRIQILLNAVDRATAPFRSVSQQVQQATQKIKQSRDAIKAINETTSKIEGFKKLSEQVSKAGRKMQDARAKVRELRQQMQQVEEPTEEMRRAMERAKQEVQRLRQSHQNLTREQRQAADALQELGIDTNRLSDHERELQQRLNRTNQELEEQRRAAQRLQQQQERLNRARDRYNNSMNTRNQLAGAGASMIAGGTTMALPVLKAINSYSQFEDAMKGVAKQVDGLRDENGERTQRFFELQQEIKNAAEQLPMANGAIDYAALVEGGARMGVANSNDSFEDQKRDLLTFASTAAKAATAFELPADELAESMGKIAGLYKIPIKDIEQLGDMINYLDDNAMSKGSDILDVLQRMGSNADKLNIKNAAALGSTLLTLGTAAEVAASTSNAMVRELSTATKFSKTRMQGLKAIGMTAKQVELDMVNDSMGSIQKILTAVNKLPKEKQGGVLVDLFGKDFASGAGKIANNMDELNRQLELTHGTDMLGSMQRESNVNIDSISAEWMLLKAGLNNTFSGLGETLREPVLELIGTVKKYISIARKWVESNPELAGKIMKVVAAISAATVVLGGLALSAAAILGPMALLRFAMTTLGIRIIPMIVGGFKGVLGIVGALVSPIGLVVVAIVAAAVLIYKYWEPIKAFFIGVWEGLKASFEGISEGFEPLKPMFEWIGTTISKAIGWIKNFIKPVKSTSQELQNAHRYGKVFGEGLAFFIKMLIQPIKNLISLVSWLGGAVSSIASFFSSKWAEAGASTESTIGRLAVFWQLSLKGIGDAIINSDFAQSLKDKAGEALNYFSAKWDEAGNKTDNSLIRIGLFFKNSFNGITKEIINWGLKSGFKAKVDELLEYLTSIQMQFAQIGKDIAISIWNGIKNEFTALQSDISNLLKSTFSFGKAEVSVNQTTSGTSGAVASALENLPKFDRGGILGNGKIGLVGENGPELINGPANITSRLQTAKAASLAASLAMISPADAPIHPFAKSAPISASQQTQSVTITAPITIHAAPGQSAEQIAQVVQRELQKQMRNASRPNLSSYRDS